MENLVWCCSDSGNPLLHCYTCPCGTLDKREELLIRPSNPVLWAREQVCDWWQSHAVDQPVQSVIVYQQCGWALVLVMLIWFTLWHAAVKGFFSPSAQQNFKGPFYLLAKQFVHFGFLVCVWVTWSSAQIPPRRCTSSSVHIDWSTTSIAVFRLLNRLVVSVATKKKKSSAAFCFLAVFGAALSASIQLKWLVCNVRPHRKELIHASIAGGLRPPAVSGLSWQSDPGPEPLTLISGSVPSTKWATATPSQRIIKVNFKQLF